MSSGQELSGTQELSGHWKIPTVYCSGGSGEGGMQEVRQTDRKKYHCGRSV